MQNSLCAIFTQSKFTTIIPAKTMRLERNIHKHKQPSTYGSAPT